MDISEDWQVNEIGIDDSWDLDPTLKEIAGCIAVVAVVGIAVVAAVVAAMRMGGAL